MRNVELTVRAGHSGEPQVDADHRVGEGHPDEGDQEEDCELKIADGHGDLRMPHGLTGSHQDHVLREAMKRLGFVHDRLEDPDEQSQDPNENEREHGASHCCFEFEEETDGEPALQRNASQGEDRHGDGTMLWKKEAKRHM